MTVKSTPRQFRATAERAFRNANPDAVQTGLVLTWNWSRRVTFPTGIRGFCGSLTAAAPGYKPTTRNVSWDEVGGLSV